jgi:hypothetical protein
MIQQFLKDNRGVVEWFVAAALFVGSLFLPAVQKDRQFNVTTAPGAPVIQQAR